MEKIFRIEGWFEKNNNKLEFEKEVPADSKDRAIDLLYSELGSKHAVKRNLVTIDNVEEIELEEVEDREVREALE